MAKRSAGLLLYRGRAGQTEVFLVHPGGPIWAKRDEGAWGVPKGELDPGEDGLTAAQREFTEETGFRAEGPFLSLGEVRQASGKVVEVWACAGECDPSALRSNTCAIEWPPRSGRRIEIPEVDRGGWFALEAAEGKMVEGQRPLLARLREKVDSRSGVA